MFPLIHFSSDNADAPVYIEHSRVMQNCKNMQDVLLVISWWLALHNSHFPRFGTCGLALPKIKCDEII